MKKVFSISLLIAFIVVMAGATMMARARAAQTLGEPPNWLTAVSTNGERFRIDLNSIHRFAESDPKYPGMATAVVYRDFGSQQIDERHVHRILFDCIERYSAWGHQELWIEARPNSTIRAISDVACGRIDPTKR